MNPSLDDTITNAGDSHINTITALGEMQYITSHLSSSIANLEEFISEQLSYSIPTKVAKRQI